MLVALLATIFVLGLAQADLFASLLYSELAMQENRDNVVISPSALRSALGMAYIGAEGEAAADLKHVMYLHGDTKNMVLDDFDRDLNIHTPYVELKLAYRLYVHHNFPIQGAYQSLAIKHFRTAAENVNFDHAEAAAKHMSAYIEAHTAHKFKDTIQPVDIGTHTKLFLTTGFYFNGKWERPFGKISIRRPFYFTPSDHVPVMMYGKTDELLCGDLPDWDAKGVEIPYRTSNLSMLIILPNQRTENLRDLEKAIRTTDFRTVNNRFERAIVHIEMPQFRVEYQIKLNEVLHAMGLKSLFTNPDFGSLSHKPGLRISTIKQKGIIDVNIATNDEVHADLEVNLNNTPKNFIVDHQFMYIIKDPYMVYFVGRVLKLQ
ncbi:serine protease inhibitor 42Dd-like [Scaptodrosophila lebanonensis]|uniref:Serine protease inhibitor 42Dd-like n=1 Tax=Drosophila lebanonensis TaxID=7225 RepID=A0A6J2TJW4_DROLE|nr:serine protease inhibitor 42Dd-like [Scaptodrosophila lebanonensis]